MGPSPKGPGHRIEEFFKAEKQLCCLVGLWGGALKVEVQCSVELLVVCLEK